MAGAARTAVLAAARARLAGDGYERATLRAIAKDACIDASMVMRHHGSKEGLFATAVPVVQRVPPDPEHVPARARWWPSNCWGPR